MSQGKWQKRSQQVVQDYLDALLFDPDAGGETVQQDTAAGTDEPGAEHTPVAVDSAAVSDADKTSTDDELKTVEDVGTITRCAARAEAETAELDDTESRADAEMIAAFGDSEDSAVAGSDSGDAESRANAEMIAAASGARLEKTTPVRRPSVVAQGHENPTLGYRPRSVADEFNAVMVKMHGLNLAVPSDQIEGAQHLHKLALTLDTRHDWLIGRYESRRGPVQVVDTALWLIPERYDPMLANYREVLVLAGGHWALSCDELIKSLRLHSDRINWNGRRDQRPWLLGTYLSERCFLVDVPVLLGQFASALSGGGGIAYP